MAEVIGIDHIYVAVSDLAQSELFYDQALVDVLEFKKNKFILAGDPHIQYFNRHFGFVLRPAREQAQHQSYAPGLHHFCLRVDSAEEVHAVASQLRAKGIAATDAKHYPEYAHDYVATFFTDPDGIRLEVTNYRQERRERYVHFLTSNAKLLCPSNWITPLFLHGTKLCRPNFWQSFLACRGKKAGRGLFLRSMSIKV